MHVDASAFAVGCILAQPGDGNKDFPICYVSRELNAAEKNYTTIEREGLRMVYVVKKFRHYLLANRFIFFVDHQALLYLVNKPCNTQRIIRWFIIVLEFDFTVVVKKETTHQRANHLSRLIHGEARTGVEDDLPDAYLFIIEMVPCWSEKLISLLSIGQFTSEQVLGLDKNLIQQSHQFQLMSGQLYHRDVEGSLRLCIEPFEIPMYLHDAHCNIGFRHHGKAHTYQNLMRMGVYWPKMKFDVHEHVKGCNVCIMTPTVEHVALFHVTLAPNWSKYIVDCLNRVPFPKEMSKTQVRDIQAEAQTFQLIGNQLYKLCKDNQLRISVSESEYIFVLKEAHSGVTGGHFSVERTAKTIMYTRLWWPTLFMDAESYVKRCDECQGTKIPFKKMKCQ